MTGEVSWIKPNGDDSNGDRWPVHAAVARALRCRLRPWDAYCGPYIAHKRGKLWISSEDGMSGTACLWPGGTAPAYREPITADFPNVYDTEQALDACRAVLREAGRQHQIRSRSVAEVSLQGLEQGPKA